MHSLRLVEPTTIRYPSFSGMFGMRPGTLVLRPTIGTQWWLKTRDGRVEIEPSLMERRGQQITIKAPDGTKLVIFEHIGVLRWFRLAGVEIEVVKRPPYYGRALEVWQKLLPACCETKLELPWYTVSETLRWEYPRPRGGKTAFVELRPATRPGLTVDVETSFPGIGSLRRQFSLPDAVCLREICSGYPAGLPNPRLRYTVGRLARFLLRWPHMRCVAWQQEMTAEAFMQSVTLHRAQDLLGALSLLCRDGLLAGHVVSCCAGHEADVSVVLQANTRLRRL